MTMNAFLTQIAQNGQIAQIQSLVTGGSALENTTQGGLQGGAFWQLMFGVGGRDMTPLSTTQANVNVDFKDPAKAKPYILLQKTPLIVAPADADGVQDFENVVILTRHDGLGESLEFPVQPVLVLPSTEKKILFQLKQIGIDDATLNSLTEEQKAALLDDVLKQIQGSIGMPLDMAPAEKPKPLIFLVSEKLANVLSKLAPEQSELSVVAALPPRMFVAPFSRTNEGENSEVHVDEPNLSNSIRRLAVMDKTLQSVGYDAPLGAKTPKAQMTPLQNLATFIQQNPTFGFLNESDNALLPLKDMTQLAGFEPFSSMSVRGEYSQSLPILMNAQAGTAHPASQTVAIQIQKLAAGGEDNSFAIELDPPELGRVEIRMTFSDDKTVKVNIVVERAETWLTLQRDSFMLDRALQNAGFDKGDTLLNFELGPQNQEAGGRGSQNGSESRGQSGKDLASDEIEVVETVMDWHVDPYTGQLHYNILV